MAAAIGHRRKQYPDWRSAISKAFDKVPHGMMPAKLYQHGVRGSLNPTWTLSIYNIGKQTGYIMHFNPDNYEVIRITTKWKQRITPHYIHGKELAVTINAKYIGVNISNNLSWNQHIDSVCKKWRQTAPPPYYGGTSRPVHQGQMLQDLGQT